MMPKLTKIAVGAFLTPYGGMTPYRRRFIASRCFISRDFDVDSLPKVIARPEDWFLGWVRLNEDSPPARPKDGQPDCPQFNIIPVLHPVFSALRFLIISEVSAMGDRMTYNQKQPNSLMAIGFKG